jgi:hypothetical protein
MENTNPEGKPWRETDFKGTFPHLTERGKAGMGVYAPIYNFL